MISAKNYPIVAWRCLLELAVSWALVAAAVYVTVEYSWWLYPLSAIVIANRLLAISLLAHEALHFNLLPEKKWNDFVGRYFCAFPTAISLSRYRLLHQMHHGALGSERWDPDRQLYDFYPVTPSNFFKTLALKTLRGQTAYSFFSYYTDFVTEKRGRDADFRAFLIFWAVAYGLLLYLGWFTGFLLFYVLPYLVILQPYVLIMGGLQHGALVHHDQQALRSRSIRGPKWLMEILLPLDIGYHAAHHLNPRVPYYWLKEFSAELKTGGVKLHEETYAQAWHAMFGPAAEDTKADILAKISYR